MTESENIFQFGSLVDIYPRLTHGVIWTMICIVPMHSGL